jgi:hypothetical protein
MEDCNLKEEGHGKKEDAKNKESSGAQEGRQVSKLTISEVFRWYLKSNMNKDQQQTIQLRFICNKIVITAKLI